MSESSSTESPDESTSSSPSPETSSPSSTNYSLHDPIGLRQLLSPLKHLSRLETIEDYLDQFLAHQGEEQSTTPRQAKVPNPTSEMPVSANNDEVTLSDGRSVPTTVIKALDEYDTATWPGALLPEARAAIAHVVINVIEAGQEPVLRTNYPFCLEPNPANLTYESPCVLRAGHNTRHRDNNDGDWALKED